MTEIEQLYRRAEHHLKEAQSIAATMSQCTSDWTSRIILNQEFENMSEALNEFAECQLGIRTSTSRTSTKKIAQEEGGGEEGQEGPPYYENGIVTNSWLIKGWGNGGQTPLQRKEGEA
ncbi:MAG: hypothetical protein ACYC3X_18850 [Pirellulaceae bacterium]